MWSPGGKGVLLRRFSALALALGIRSFLLPVARALGEQPDNQVIGVASFPWAPCFENSIHPRVRVGKMH